MKSYSAASVSFVSLETGSQLLTGSVTKDAVTVRTVTVDPMEDGFEDQNSFQDLSFD